jgi:hypothetical protein
LKKTGFFQIFFSNLTTVLVEKKMEKKNMEEKRNNLEAAITPQGLAKATTEKIDKIGQTLGITRNDIAATLQKKQWIQNCFILLIAAAVTIYSYAMFAKPSHYGGISSQDFNTIGQLMYNAFGRFF